MECVVRQLSPMIQQLDGTNLQALSCSLPSSVHVAAGSRVLLLRIFCGNLHLDAPNGIVHL
jgi:hypothetical protein